MERVTLGTAAVPVAFGSEERAMALIAVRLRLVLQWPVTAIGSIGHLRMSAGRQRLAARFVRTLQTRAVPVLAH